MRSCQQGDCRKETAGKYARFCDQHGKQRRGKPLKYLWSAREDEILQDAYRTHHSVKAQRVAMLRTGYPKHIISRRARVLGICQQRTKEPPWAKEELAILEEWAWQGPERIQKRLKAAGYHRTATAVQVKKKRLHISHDGYSATSLAGLLGVDATTVTRWVSLGELPARRRGTARSAAQRGDIFYIAHDDVRRFVLSHPQRIHLAKVSDALWFIDLVSGGKAGLSIQEAKQEEGIADV